MKISNVTYSSNVYVFTGNNKIIDASFMTHVLDPGAIREIAENNIKVNGTTGLRGIQKIIYDNSKPCSLGNGDYTHGTVLEDGKPVYVNKCEKTSCKLYPKCSAHSCFRPIVRPPEATFDFVKKVADPVDYIHFETITEEREGLKVPKFRKIKKIETKVIVTEVEEIIQRNNDALLWGVRPHIRHLADGTTTWVKGHYRGHGAQTTNSVAVRTVITKVIQKYKCNNPEKLRAAFARLKLRNQPFDSPQAYQLKDFLRVDSDKQIAEQIINSDIESRILVNAGPGTGKTYTVIERLKALAKKEDEIRPESVFVLCFSRSAVRVINDRLEAAIKAGKIPLSAQQFNIATFDSFATWFLRESDLNFDFSGLNYDDRIASFINLFKSNPTDLQELMGYLIIDEVQDLVGIRAELVKTLLEHTLHGFLLLGDECQAIYDYQITDPDELNAAKLYEWIERYFGQTLRKYELTRNHRNEGPIGNSLKTLRTAMLCGQFDEQKSATEELFNQYDFSDTDVDKILERCANTNRTYAILSWSNGDAYRQSSDLYSMPNRTFTHRILTGARRLSYRKEIADILSGYTNPIISYFRFLELAKNKNIDENTAISLWQGFLKVLDNDAAEINLKELRSRMVSERRVADVLLCPDTAALTISTIHKAKGKEYDTVLINHSGEISKSEDVKVYYVAMTRAKNELIIKPRINRHQDRRMESGRFVEIKQREIKRIELGIDGDIDPISFITGDNVAERQEYIASCVKQGDPITVSKRDGKYYIVHNERYIGEVRPDIFRDWRHKEPYQRWPHTYRLSKFTDFVDLFVSDVVTIVNIKLDSRMSDEYKKCGFWYGIEFCGYAKPMEE
ncbi:MAG: UvrD-helicase domain-containing protein [Clostridia bacterium]|nr:UvrD-helicase domain-containing protein [Clostridia bacterium]